MDAPQIRIANVVKEEPEFDLVPDEFLAAEAAAPAPAVPVQPAQPDMVSNAPAYFTIQDISSTSAPAAEQEKGVDYWNNINQMLGNFEQKPAAPAEPAAPAPNPVTPPPLNEERVASLFQKALRRLMRSLQRR